MFAIHRTVDNNQNYHIYRYFLDFTHVHYGEEFIDIPGPDNYTSLSSG